MYCGLYCVAFILLRQKNTWPEADAILFPESGADRDNKQMLAKVLGRDPDNILKENGYRSTSQVS